MNRYLFLIGSLIVVSGLCGGITTLEAQTQTEVAFTFRQNLAVGSRGLDVIQLQLRLEQGGYLTLPPAVVKGYFGERTQAALIKYQIAQGIVPPRGFFGPITQGKMNGGNAQSSQVVKPNSAAKPNPPVKPNPVAPCTVTDSSNINKSLRQKITAQHSTDGRHIVISFKDGSDMRLRNGVFSSLCGAPVNAINDYIFTKNNFIVTRVDGGVSEETVQGWWQKNPRLHNLNLDYYIDLKEKKNIDEINVILDTLNDFDLVRYAEPVPQAAALPAS